MARQNQTPLARLKAILASGDPAVDQAVAITELVPDLERDALDPIGEAMASAETLVRVALMDAHFEITRSRTYKQDLIRILDSAEARGDGGEELYMAARLALGRVNRRSKDALGEWGDGGLEIAAARGLRVHRERITIIVHGTWASDGTWWRPQGDFFEYVRTELDRRDLYDRQDLFMWSGKNRDSSRRKASASLEKWLKSHPSAEVNVFGHSHGANVAMLATQRDVKFHRLVMLSPPVRKDYFAKWSNVREAFNIQARKDPVVAIARGGKVFDLPQVKELTLRAKGHSSTHDPAVWRAERPDRFIGMPWPVV